ncbi:restriction endonuclease subunit S [Methylomonas sp. MS20]|uniref:restriction endonuclease subunit S n=1 Tax=unclassified Methylomonas TaxID=2608980 RepID=UPI0028A428E3|nr:restriction endonuclease subunit S [Methylomonas sp. MV1]MDT4332389.1 restriction endonuclease subunit S [Methylomonas sp. MV1]
MNELISQHLDLWTTAIASKARAGRGASSPSPAGEGRGEGNPTSPRNAKVTAYGIKKLRELILELAVRGKLVPQDPNDEPASALLEKIAQERICLIKEKKLRAPKAIPEIDEGEIPFLLPIGWEWARLDQLSPNSLVDGDWIESKDQDAFGDIRLIQLGDVGVNEFKDVSDKFINENTFMRLNCTELNHRDILIARLPSPIGRACLFPGLNQKAITVVDVAILRSLDFMHDQYLVHAINSTLFRIQVEEYGKGATRFRISTGNLKSILVPIPPKTEQHRIVAKVDELMALCDQLEQQQTDHLAAHQTLVQTLLETLTQAADAAEFEQAWSRIADHFDTLFNTEFSIDQLKQTLLQLAVMGKLVPQNINDEPANLLLQKIENEKDQLIRQGKIKKQKTYPQVSDQEKPFDIPPRWLWVRFGMLVNFQSELVRPEDFLDLDQVAPDSIEKGTGKLLFRRTVNESGIRGPNNRFYAGQILYSKIRPSLSKAIIASFDGLCSADMYPLESKIHVDFLLKVILSEPFLQQVRILENRIKMPKLNVDSLSSIVVPLPPLVEQHRIVAKVDELMALCDALKARIAAAQTTQLQLADAIVEQAVA